MVATRRQAQAGLDEEVVLEQDPDHLLKKKATRKPVVKSVATTKADTKSKGTLRAKKPGPDAVEELAKPATKAARTKKITVEADPAPIRDEDAQEGRVSRAAKTGSMRGKKATAVMEDTPKEEEPAVSRPTRSTKTATVKGSKATSTVEQPAQEVAVQNQSTGGGSIRGRKPAASTQNVALAAPQEPKITRSTRGTTKAAPLSPKKITQVNKAPAKAAKLTNAKPPLKTTRGKAQGNGKSVGRKRTVSDENAGLPDLVAATEGVEDDEEVVVLPSTPIQKHKAPKRVVKQTEPMNAAESEASMSSRPTTPSDSPVQSFNSIQEEADNHEDIDSASEAGQIDAGEEDASEDELCGPKTPMRRSTPSALARYQSSVQRTIQRHQEDSRMETPAIRYAILGTQRGTPQTQKPYCKPTAPNSEARPMTVSRAAGRAFVFKDLRDGAQSFPQADESLDEQNEPSFLVDENIIPMDTAEGNDHNSFLTSHPHPAMDMNEAQLIASGLLEEDAEDYVVPANVQKYSDDPDDTVVIHDDGEDLIAPSEHPAQSFETEDTVIITRASSIAQDENMSTNEDDDDEDSVIIHPTHHAMAPEELPAALIAVNFEEHLKDVRTQSEEIEFRIVDSPADATRTHKHHQDANEVEPADIEPDVLVTHNVSRRQTFDLNQFIDFAGGSEPTVHVETDMNGMDASDLDSSATEGPQETALDQASAFESTDQVIHHPIAPADQRATPTDVINDVEAQVPVPAEQQAQDFEAVEGIGETQVPHYALPTIAFDARRRSLPVLSLQTPIRIGGRPNTSDGASMPRIANPFNNTWWTRAGAKSTSNTPARARPRTANATPNASSFNTPVRARQSIVTDSTVKTPMERYPLFPSRTAYEGHWNTVAAPVRFGTPSKDPPKRRETFHRAVGGKIVGKVADSTPSTPAALAVATPKERYPVLRPREDYEEHAKTVAAPKRFQSPALKSPDRRQTFHKVLSGRTVEAIAAAMELDGSDPKTPVPEPANAIANAETPATEKTDKAQERYPRLRPRLDYEEHAKTVAGPKRFHTPVKTSLKRPATVGKSNSLRFAAFAANTSSPSHTPLKTPLKAPAMTPSQAPMTPHPAAPLRDVVALVEVFTLEGASASAPFISLLHRLGAKTTRAWNDRITHVVFKDGSPTTLQRIRLNNKEFEETGCGTYIHCVNSRWVTDCDTEGTRVDESRDAYVVDVSEVPRGGKRRRKSMEPSALLNLGGNIVRDRKSSGGRVSSIGRSPLKFAESPAKIVELAEVGTPDVNVIGKENSGDEQSSPATPAWIAAPSQLVQHTAPLKRVRKLELPDGGEAKSRRLTFWNGAA